MKRKIYALAEFLENKVGILIHVDEDDVLTPSKYLKLC